MAFNAVIKACHVFTFTYRRIITNDVIVINDKRCLPFSSSQFWLVFYSSCEVSTQSLELSLELLRLDIRTVCPSSLGQTGSKS